MVALDEATATNMIVRLDAHLARAHAPWHAAQPQGAAERFIRDMIGYAERHGLEEEASVRALLDLALTRGLPDPLPPLPRHLLTRAGFAEARRVADFRDALLHPQVELVRLDLGAPAAGPR